MARCFSMVCGIEASYIPDVLVQYPGYCTCPRLRVGLYRSSAIIITRILDMITKLISLKMIAISVILLSRVVSLYLSQMKL